VPLWGWILLALAAVIAVPIKLALWKRLLGKKDNDRDAAESPGDI